LVGLDFLAAYSNGLLGSLPPSFANLRGMMTLDLSDNQLFDRLSLQKWHGGLEMVQAIDLSNNNLSGSIPSAIGGCRNLYLLDLVN